MKLDDLVRRAEELIQDGMDVLSTKKYFSNLGFSRVNKLSFEKFRAGTLSFFLLCYGTDHPY